jgi:putative tryptophan/tyrosine transport system substrate-binding protein
MSAIARPCRRAFIGFLATAATWPLTGRAQPRSLPVIGFLHSGSPEANVKRLEGFRRGLAEGGFGEGTDVVIEYRWAEGRADRLPELAADLVRREVAVIATPGSAPAALAAKQATATVPVVFATGGDPIGLGLVTSLSRPAGNVTGVASLNADLAAKRLAICRELVPQAAHYFALVNPTSPLTESYTKELLAGAATLGIAVRVLRASTDDEIEAAFAILPQQAGNVVIFGPDAFFYIRRDKIAALAVRKGVPTIFDTRDYAEAGGLASYGADFADLMQQAGNYTARILKGEKPANLPVIQSTKFELVINLRTAKALAIAIPNTVLALADEVID